MSDLVKNNIFLVPLLYIIRLIVISLILFNFNKSFAEESLIEAEPFEIWGQSTSQSIPQLENSNFEAESIEDDLSVSDPSSLEGVIKSDFSYSIDDTIGLYDKSNGGFSPDIWKFSNYKDINYLINELPLVTINDEILRLKLIALLTVATPPIDSDQSNENFLNLKLRHLKSIGDYDSIFSISEFIDDSTWDQNLVDNIISFHLLKANYKNICNKNIFNKVSRENISLKIRAFCNAMSNNLPAIDLIISLIIEEETYDDELVYILNSYLNETEININKIKNMDLFKLNLINNKNIDFSEIINENSEIELQLFYVLAKTKSNIKKISLTENLISRGIINPLILADVYEKYMTENKIEIDIDLNSLSSGVEKRALLYNQIRKTSNQDDLISLASIYVENMGNVNLLNNSATLIYDKIKVISPKQEHRKHAPSVCLLLLLNNDFDQCQNWLSNLDFVSEAEEIKTKIRLYLSLSNNITDFNQNDIDYLLSSDDELSEKQKNILVKYSELKYQEDLIDYWKSENEFNQIQTILPNIKLVEYLKSIPLKNKGEIILLISLIHGNQPSNSLDQYSLFLIMESLNKLDPIYLDNFVFEYLVNNPV